MHATLTNPQVLLVLNHHARSLEKLPRWDISVGNNWVVSVIKFTSTKNISGLGMKRRERSVHIWNSHTNTPRSIKHPGLVIGLNQHYEVCAPRSCHPFQRCRLSSSLKLPTSFPPSASTPPGSFTFHESHLTHTIWGEKEKLRHLDTTKMLSKGAQDEALLLWDCWLTSISCYITIMYQSYTHTSGHSCTSTQVTFQGYPCFLESKGFGSTCTCMHTNNTFLYCTVCQLYIIFSMLAADTSPAYFFIG